MRRFRRRKPRVVWLPTYGHAFGIEGANTAAGYVRESVSFPTSGEIQVDAFPLTWDGTESSAVTQAVGTGSFTLNDFVNGQSYRLRRIVGNLVLTASNQGISTDVVYTDVVVSDVAAGIMVYRTKQDQTVDTDTLLTHNPLNQDAMQDPWVWRRRWQFWHGTGDLATPGFALAGDNTGSADVVEPRWQALPRNNLWGSVAEGSKIDQKTARVISNDERLYLVIAARCLTKNKGASTIGSFIGVDFDYRLLASMRSNQGNRRNASR